MELKVRGEKCLSWGLLIKKTEDLKSIFITFLLILVCSLRLNALRVENFLSTDIEWCFAMGNDIINNLTKYETNIQVKFFNFVIRKFFNWGFMEMGSFMGSLYLVWIKSCNAICILILNNVKMMSKTAWLTGNVISTNLCRHKVD